MSYINYETNIDGKRYIFRMKDYIWHAFYTTEEACEKIAIWIDEKLKQDPEDHGDAEVDYKWYLLTYYILKKVNQIQSSPHFWYLYSGNSKSTVAILSSI